MLKARLFPVAGRARCSGAACAGTTTAKPATTTLLPKNGYISVQECIEAFKNFSFVPGQGYCDFVHDSYLCWPTTRAGETVSQRCPPGKLSDTTRSAYRRCGTDGLWVGKRPGEMTVMGWTNYTPCFPPDVQNLFNKVFDSELDGQLKFKIAQSTRYMEIAGFGISLLALIFSLIIFAHYRTLRNNRTRIHKSLFCAMVVQVIIRLTLYIDQALIRSNPHSTYRHTQLKGIDNMPYVCEGSYILLEYATSVMFMWMLIEGLYLNNVVTANALRERVSFKFYYALGWGLPLLVTIIWSTVTAIHYQRDNVKQCWYGYNFSNLFWIMQAPRLAVIMINLVFLLNIMRVLIVKLRRSQNTEMEKIKKAVRAALVLLPLLGITNVLNMIEAPLDGSGWRFGLWSYSTYFLRSFQGFFIALIYCFLNGEVRQVLRKHYDDHQAMRGDNGRAGGSFFHFMSSRENARNRQAQAPMIALRRLTGLRISNITFDPDMTADTYKRRPLEKETQLTTDAPETKVEDGTASELGLRDRDSGVSVDEET